MFIAGMLLPENFYARLEPTIQELGQQFGILEQALETTMITSETASSTQANAIAKTEAADKSNASEEEDITHYAELMLSVHNVEGSLFGLQAGLYSDESMAKQMQARLLHYEIPSFYIRIADDQKRHWYLLYFGKYSNIDDAQTASYEFLTKSGYKSQIIRLPVPKK